MRLEPLSILFALALATAPYSQTDSTKPTTLPQKEQISFTYKGLEYDAILVNPERNSIQMYWLSRNTKPCKTIASLKKELEKAGKVLMVTNGGMFHKGNTPVGLFISKGIIQRPLDTSINKEGNFYLQPNGVFWINDKGKAGVKTTKSFQDSMLRKSFKPFYATQSGPMLLSNGNINPTFNANSTNLNLRSGVGVRKDGTVIFVISKSNQASFYDFASVFKTYLSCINALYLDGAISKMYLSKLRPTDQGGELFRHDICLRENQMKYSRVY